MWIKISEYDIPGTILQLLRAQILFWAILRIRFMRMILHFYFRR